MIADIGQGQAGSPLERSALTVGASLADQCLPGLTEIWPSRVRGYRRHLAPGTARGIDLDRPYLKQPTAALPRLLIARALCATREAQSSVARGARLTAASCFHTLEILDPFDLGALVAELPSDSATALFCVERDPEACHRSLVAARLRAEHGMPVTDLRPG